MLNNSVWAFGVGYSGGAIPATSDSKPGIGFVLLVLSWSVIAWFIPLAQVDNASVWWMAVITRFWPFAAATWIMTKAWLDGGCNLRGFCREARSAVNMWVDVFVMDYLLLPLSVGATLLRMDGMKFSKRRSESLFDEIREDPRHHGMHLDTALSCRDQAMEQITAEGDSIADVIETAGAKGAAVARTAVVVSSIATSAYAQSTSPSPTPSATPWPPTPSKVEAKVDMIEVMANGIGTGDTPQRLRTEVGGFVRSGNNKLYLYNLCDFKLQGEAISCLADAFFSNTKRPWLIGMAEVSGGSQTKFSMTAGPRINFTDVPTIGKTVSKAFRNLAVMPLIRVVGPAPKVQLRVAVKTQDYPIASSWTGYTEWVYITRPGQDYSFIDVRFRHKKMPWLAPGFHFEPFQHRAMVGVRFVIR